MYQLYAYGKKYELEHNKGRAQKVKPPHLVLLYPENENFKKRLDNFTYEGDLQLDIIPFSFAKGMEENQVRSILDIIADRTRVEAINQYQVIPSVVSQVVIISNREYQDRIDKKGFIPLYSLRAACGRFESEELPTAEGWIDASENGFTPDPEKHFVIYSKGDSMLPVIKDGNLCVFEWYNAGSREGNIVLTQSNSYDADYDGQYTIKKYHSEKTVNEEGWQHSRIQLIPLNPLYPTIEITPEDGEQYRTIGVFKTTL